MYRCGTVLRASQFFEEGGNEEKKYFVENPANNLTRSVPLNISTVTTRSPKPKGGANAAPAPPGPGYSQDRVPILAAEVRGVLNSRNELAAALAAFENSIYEEEEEEGVGGVMLTQRSAAVSAVAFGASLAAPELPPLLKNPFNCGYCPQRRQCATLHAAVDGGCAESSGFDDKVILFYFIYR